MKTPQLALAVKIPRTWDDLASLWAPRPIRSKPTHQKALAVINQLMDVEKPTRDQKDYFEMVTVLIEKYESTRTPKPKFEPLGNLKFLLEQNELNTTDLGDIIGSKSLASRILNGERQMSKAVIEKLSNRFKVSPAVFFDESN